MTRHLITVLLLIVAVIFYSIGAAGPGIVFLLLGGIAELGFWLRLFKRQ
ncbi:MAG: hypothetical protein ACR2Q3_10970 [Woeseiaceae bacterium]